MICYHFLSTPNRNVILEDNLKILLNKF